MEGEGIIRFFGANFDSAPTTLLFVIYLLREKSKRKEKRQKEGKTRGEEKGRLEVCAKLIVLIWKERMNQSPFFFLTWILIFKITGAVIENVKILLC